MSDMHSDLRALWRVQPDEWRRQFGERPKLRDYFTARSMEREHDDTLRSLVEAVVESQVGVAREQLLRTYDGSLRRFLLALGQLDATRAARGQCAGHNDMMDVGHFLYLEAGVQLVTDDIGMREAAISIGCDVFRSADIREPHGSEHVAL